MSNLEKIKIPPIVEQILKSTHEIGFDMTSEPLIGSFLKTLAMTKPAGNFLELGTGTGVSSAWLLEGMDAQSTLISVENEPKFITIAEKFLNCDKRVKFVVEDGGIFLEKLVKTKKQFDLIFADTWAGKYTHFTEAISVLKSGGIYVIDDMLPQPNWPQGHELKVAHLVSQLENSPNLSITKMNWASGVIIAVKR